MNIKSFSVTFLCLSIFSVLAWQIFFIDQIVAQTGSFGISVDLLTEAGFTNVIIQEQEGTRFMPPVKYFRVNETLSGAQAEAWGDSSNLVAVLAIPTPYRDSSIHKERNAQIIDLEGRTQVRVITEGHYIVVTGPEMNKVGELARFLAEIYP